MDRDQAYKKYIELARAGVPKAHNLELIRLCRVFTTASADLHRKGEAAIGVSCRNGETDLILKYGGYLYNCADIKAGKIKP